MDVASRRLRSGATTAQYRTLIGFSMRGCDPRGARTPTGPRHYSRCLREKQRWTKWGGDFHAGMHTPHGAACWSCGGARAGWSFGGARGGTRTFKLIICELFKI
ncbi:hypothetical protein MTP99_015607 [Tenebrio molitor]|nr:hypothetical protein MTP99_015607 [Tenebrio molitor]